MEYVVIALGTLGALVFKNKDEESVVSSINGKTYRVIKTGDYRAAADMLARLEDKARAFIDAAIVAYPNENHIGRIRKFWTGTISEIPATDTIAYALEKKELYLCVRDSAGKVQKIDDLFFVLLHELSHIMNETYGHGEDFWTQFKKTLEIANRLGYLPYKNYDDYSVTVCGKEITSNPMSCVLKGECYSELRPIRPK